MCNKIPKRWRNYQAVTVFKKCIVKCDRPTYFRPHLALKSILSHSLIIAVSSLYLENKNELPRYTKQCVLSNISPLLLT